MANYIGNAFSLGMLDCLADGRVNVECEQVSLDEARAFVAAHDPASCVGHEDTARLFSALLGVAVPMNRVSTSLVPGDVLLAGQYNGPRLPEGATSLPEGARIRWIVARVSRAI